MSESFAELFEESLAHTEMRQGAIITGTVVDVTPDVVVINAGLKSEGVIDVNEFRNEEGEIDVKVGDEVDVALEYIENGYGETSLSREKAKRNQAWKKLEKTFESTISTMKTWGWKNRKKRPQQ